MTTLAPGVRVRSPGTRGTVTRSHEFWGWFVKWDNRDVESGPYHDDDLQALLNHPADSCACTHVGAGFTAPVSGLATAPGAPNEMRNE